MLLARAAWVFVAVETVALVLAGFLAHRRDLLIQPQLRPALHQINLPSDLFVAVAYVIPWIALSVAGVYIFLRRSRDWMAMFWSLGVLMGGAWVSQALFVSRIVYPWTRPLVEMNWTIETLLVVPLTLFLFPDGRFVPRWTIYFFIGLCAAHVFLSDIPRTMARVPQSLEFISDGKAQFILAIAGIVIAAGIAAQISRYRNYSTEVQRTQTKLVVGSLIGLVASFNLSFVLLMLNLDAKWSAYALMVAALMALIYALAITVSIMKYRLYNIDLVINRTIVYALLTALLAFIYAGAVVAFQFLLRPLQQESSFAVAASTLLVAALFRPIRSRVQQFIDRRFYQTRYDAIQTVDNFTRQLRDEVDLDKLSSDLVSVVRSTMDPVYVSLWLRPQRRTARRT